MEDLKKYRIPIIGGISGLAIAFMASNLNYCGFMEQLRPEWPIFMFVVTGAIVAFVIDKVWK